MLATPCSPLTVSDSGLPVVDPVVGMFLVTPVTALTVGFTFMKGYVAACWTFTCKSHVSGDVRRTRRMPEVALPNATILLWVYDWSQRRFDASPAVAHSSPEVLL
jgi:hypothetical protein